MHAAKSRFFCAVAALLSVPLFVGLQTPSPATTIRLDPYPAIELPPHAGYTEAMAGSAVRFDMKAWVPSRWSA